ncbi:hypothetical protein HP15_900 [Marinobacter adhaerens HP15]|uniref:Uncharacterized protein n=1 Tax=Marinobacter adhaerens (strain DSM 23420 / HP15) TaxID=225937 RepID=E4PEV9_MARAH|nr:hypothetical protein HP15_900 [Marinobacter adhaerens HP15]
MVLWKRPDFTQHCRFGTGLFGPCSGMVFTIRQYQGASRTALLMHRPIGKPLLA